MRSVGGNEPGRTRPAGIGPLTRFSSPLLQCRAGERFVPPSRVYPAGPVGANSAGWLVAALGNNLVGHGPGVTFPRWLKESLPRNLPARGASSQPAEPSLTIPRGIGEPTMWPFPGLGQPRPALPWTTGCYTGLAHRPRWGRGKWWETGPSVWERSWKLRPVAWCEGGPGNRAGGPAFTGGPKLTESKGAPKAVAPAGVASPPARVPPEGGGPPELLALFSTQSVLGLSQGKVPGDPAPGGPPTRPRRGRTPFRISHPHGQTRNGGFPSAPEAEGVVGGMVDFSPEWGGARAFVGTQSRTGVGGGWAVAARDRKLAPPKTGATARPRLAAVLPRAPPGRSRVLGPAQSRGEPWPHRVPGPAAEVPKGRERRAASPVQASPSPWRTTSRR